MHDVEIRRREITDLVTALIVLSLGFSIALSGNGILGGGINWGKVVAWLPLSIFVLIFAFIGHEMAHRQVARRLGYYAWFQADYTFLPLAVIFPLLFGFVFAAPGAVHISPFRFAPYANEKRDIFLISAAGPLTNIAFAALGIILASITNSIFWWFFAYINAWLALFNSLPLPPLDGSKMIKTNAPMWLAIIATSGLLVWQTLR